MSLRILVGTQRVFQESMMTEEQFLLTLSSPAAKHSRKIYPQARAKLRTPHIRWQAGYDAFTTRRKCQHHPRRPRQVSLRKSRFQIARALDKPIARPRLRGAQRPLSVPSKAYQTLSTTSFFSPSCSESKRTSRCTHEESSPHQKQKQVQ